MIRDLGDAIEKIHRWLSANDEAKGFSADLVLHQRCMKVGAEAGEVLDAVSITYGQNPRKMVEATLADVSRELLDVAVTALVAWRYINDGDAPEALVDHAMYLLEREQLG